MRFAIFIVLLGSSWTLSATPLPLDAVAWPLTPYAAVWLDPSGQADLATARQAPFQPAGNPSHGYRWGALWLRLDITNPGPPVERVLRVEPAMLEQVDLWEVHGTQIGHQSAGLAVPVAARAMPGRCALFPLHLAGGTSTLYLRLESPSTLNPGLVLWQSPALLRDASGQDIRSALVFGALLMVVQLALIYCVWMRAWIWGYFAAGIFSYILYQACYEGFAALWLWPGQPSLSLRVLPVAAALTQIMLAVFILNFIPTRGLHGAWRFLWGLPLATLLALIAVFTLDYRIGMRLMQGIALVYSVTLPLFSLTAWRHGFRPASYALASFGLFYVVTVLRIGVLIGWWPALYGIDLWLLPLAGVLMSNLLLMAQMEQLRESRATQLTNLAELAAARDAAHRANRAKGMFLARVSHDLRTPLHTLSGYLELAQRESPGGALKRYLELIAVSGQKMLSLIEELLQFARGEEGRLELNAKPTFLHLQIQQAAEQAEGLAARNANRFMLDLDLEIPVAVLDGERLHSVLMNLLSNACRMTYGGRVTLSVVGKAAGRVAHLRCAVSDTGPGIAPEDQERVFLPFEQGRSGAGSTGLGLAIARQLVRLMGGELSLKSRPGEGATFSFILTVPLADESEVPPPATLSAPFGYEGSVRTLLVVDDVPENRAFLQDLLTGMGFDCLLAEGVSQALRLAEGHRLDAAIVDQYLGDGDGWEILAGLKSRCPALPVILLSATPAEPSRRQSSVWTFDAELLKPLRIDTLTRVLGDGLHLVWQTQRRVASTPPSPAPAAAPAAEPVTTADLLSLRQAAHEGSLFEVEDWIDSRRDRPEERTFVDQLSVMAADAQLGAIVRLVDRRMAAMDEENMDSASAD